MKKIVEQELMENPQVVEEIKRHLWIESEKAGRDVGFDYAKKDWMLNFAADWVKANGKPKKTVAKKKTVVKKRRAKSYMDK